MPTLTSNKMFRLNFDPIEVYEAGIELSGFEVKSLRHKHGSLEGAHVVVRGGEAYLVNMRIPPYQPANTPKDYDPDRPRRLLVGKKELGELAGYERQKGLTIVPVSMYTRGRNLKVEIAAARGKKKFDKREDLKKKTAKRDVDRVIKHKR